MKRRRREEKSAMSKMRRKTAAKKTRRPLAAKRHMAKRRYCEKRLKLWNPAIERKANERSYGAEHCSRLKAASKQHLAWRNTWPGGRCGGAITAWPCVSNIQRAHYLRRSWPGADALRRKLAFGRSCNIKLVA